VREMGLRSLEEYNQKLVSLIRRAGREVYLAIRNKEHPYPSLIFRDDRTQETAIVNLKGQQFATFYKGSDKKFDVLQKRHNVFLKLEGAREVMKWLGSMPI
jgi:hypothetical protein